MVLFFLGLYLSLSALGYDLLVLGKAKMKCTCRRMIYGVHDNCHILWGLYQTQ